MDQKKQTLTPELKEIYDRVMNTQAANPVVPAPIANATQAPPIQPANPASPFPLQSPVNPVAQPAANEGFLSSVPPRPLTDTKSFVFTGNKITTQDKQSTVHAPNPAGKKISSKIIALIVGVVIIMWSVLWAMIFGLF